MTQFWLNNPSILMKKDNILNIWPKKNMEQNEKLNSITRLVIILSVIGYTLTENIKEDYERSRESEKRYAHRRIWLHYRQAGTSRLRIHRGQ